MAVQFDYTIIAERAAQVVSAYVSKNNVAPADLPGLIRSVAETLASLGTEPEAEAKPQPAVDVQKSVSKRHLTCLLCGKKMKMLRRHLSTAHKMAPTDYRQTFGLKSDYPMSTPEYSAMRSQMARDIGLGRQSKSRSRRSKASKGENKRTASKEAA
jgi:predicted transcriptional regulator